jgi:hypothetical protein
MLATEAVRPHTVQQADTQASTMQRAVALAYIVSATCHEFSSPRTCRLGHAPAAPANTNMQAIMQQAAS